MSLVHHFRRRPRRHGAAELHALDGDDPAVEEALAGGDGAEAALAERPELAVVRGAAGEEAEEGLREGAGLRAESGAGGCGGEGAGASEIVDSRVTVVDGSAIHGAWDGAPAPAPFGRLASRCLTARSQPRWPPVSSAAAIRQRAQQMG